MIASFEHKLAELTQMVKNKAIDASERHAEETVIVVADQLSQLENCPQNLVGKVLRLVERQMD